MRDANGANLTWADRRRCGEKGVGRGSGRGPWTVQLSFRPAGVFDVSSSAASPGGGGSSSKYAEPEAEGVRPVLMTMGRNN